MVGPADTSHFNFIVISPGYNFLVLVIVISLVETTLIFSFSLITKSKYDLPKSGFSVSYS